IGYITIPLGLHVFLTFFFNNNFRIATFHVYISELAICSILLYRIIRKNSNYNEIFLLASFISVFLQI
ncbi:MAG: hypothetical protein KKA19_02080, partial [Candidatus Margulisbacteria bacterium]|nr:hypothetical protein [Candidatus Margulisiibacteriota bacterium]